MTEEKVSVEEARKAILTVKKFCEQAGTCMNCKFYRQKEEFTVCNITIPEKWEVEEG